MFDLVSFIPRAVMQGIPLLYGSTGEILTEKSGNLNLGIPGVMYVGGICGVIGAFFYEQAVPVEQMNAFLAIGIPMLCSLLGALLMGLIYSVLTITLRAVGESPATADAAGISVTKYKYLATCIGSMVAGLGGLYYVMDYACGVWSNNAFGDRGWLAIALVIFTIWRPNVSILASILFGGFYILYLYIPSGLDLSVKELCKMIPYVVTLVVLIIVSMRKKREDQPPASLGLAYFREER